MAPPTDPNMLFDTRRDLDDFHVLDELTTIVRPGRCPPGTFTSGRITAIAGA
jgi:hypothetical protein